MPKIKFIQLTKVDSTNQYLGVLSSKQNLPELTTVVANYQTSGRGQRGNSWESTDSKNLLFSFLLRPSFLEIKKQFSLSQIISLAIKEELEAHAKGFSIKWPNDIYWQEKKICGILIENDLIGNQISRTIVGIGININQEEFYSSAPNPVSLKQITNKEYNLSTILENILNRIASYYEQLKDGDSEKIASSYHQSLFRNQGMHLYQDKSGKFMAQIEKVTPEGPIILKDEAGQEREYAFKEVSYIL